MARKVGARKVGAPTKCTPALVERLCEKLRKTLPIEKACAIVGIDPVTYYSWCERGQSGEAPYAAFLKAVTMARSEAQEFWLDMLRNSSSDRSFNPAAAMYVLERSDRGNWGREQPIVQQIVLDPQSLRDSQAQIEQEDI